MDATEVERIREACQAADDAPDVAPCAKVLDPKVGWAAKFAERGTCH
jgi:hypothetical protein